MTGWSLPDALLTACDNLAEGMVIIDEDRCIRYMNPAAAALIQPRQVAKRHLRCRAVLRCGPPGQPNGYCGCCRVSQAMLQGVATPFFEAAVGPEEMRVPVDASVAPVPGPSRSAVILLRRRPGVVLTEPDSQGNQPVVSVPGQAVLRSLVRSARHLLAADYAGLGRVDVSASEVAWLVQDGNRTEERSASRVPLGEGIRGRVVSTGEPVYIKRFPEESPDPSDRHPTMEAEGLRAALAVPVYIRDEPTGVLMIASRNMTEYGPEHTQMLRVLAGLAGEVMADADWIVSAQAASIRAEREWLAAELHDGLAQLLAALNQRLKLARWVLGRSTDPMSLSAEFQEVLELSEQAHKELRLALGELRTPAADKDFMTALEATLENFSRRCSLAAQLVEVPVHRPPLPAPVALQVLRVIQEALTNARKHSGGTQVWVRWTYAAGMHTFTIADNGHGFSSDAAGPGYGLTIMAERAHKVGGQMTVVSEPQSGCTVVLTIPDHLEGGRTAGETDPSVAS